MAVELTELTSELTDLVTRYGIVTAGDRSADTSLKPSWQVCWHTSNSRGPVMMLLPQMLFWNSLVVSDKQASKYCCHSGEVQPECCNIQHMSLCFCLCYCWWQWKVITNSRHSFWCENILAILHTHFHMATIIEFFCYAYVDPRMLCSLQSIFSIYFNIFPSLSFTTSISQLPMLYLKSVGLRWKEMRAQGWSSCFWRLLSKCSFTASSSMRMGSG